MAGPFYAAIKGSTAGTPGTGAFTPNAAVAMCRAWSTVPAGWIGLVRYEDGSAWELRYSYWNGTTLSRTTNAFVDSSSGSGLSLASTATAAMVVDPNEVQPHIGGSHFSSIIMHPGVTLATAMGMAQTNVGTAGTGTIAATNFLTEQPRVIWTSATTANAQAGAAVTALQCVHSTTSGRGGGEFACRFGASQLPTGPRLFCGFTATTFVGNTGEPSALTANYAIFGKDSTDTNIQIITNSNAGGGTKIDTGIPLVANSFYEASIWFEPGGGRFYFLLIRLDTGDIYYGSTTTDIPANGALFMPQIIGGLSSTTGTAFIMNIGSMSVRAGG